ncbi:uncharacterized protein K452DRAFT_319281 [Aplosporella prunicola CBS 121167]|uniref:SWR1-complex protein 3 domain-containing protein n=1 Tax=Aplosporella prunicola CBS 121167 TaxID=1176127 RepID=A0A6A6BBN0_9PEZI|nr:uncharacterized protein K452DRAFT_319281 [Aplosporella prunicola CBS 121167]KAF2141008.1 hypothetical protein K452DRAFT_319281 [Aplosporella prunicola CBS 121167]
MVEIRRRNPARSKPAEADNSKKRKHTPVKEKTVEPAAPAPAPAPLPTKLLPGQPIPTLQQPQPPHLPLSEWQSVLESGVLKSAIEKSRQRWMTPGLFELYYSKAGKKKVEKMTGNSTADQEQLKAKQMKREGNCKLMIEPHIWDVTIWTMRENVAPLPPRPKQPVHQPPPYYYGGYAAAPPYPPYQPYASPVQPAHAQSRPPPSQQPPVRQSSQTASFNSPRPAGPNQPNQPNPPDANGVVSPPAPDPVIHMLAERANTNFKLRDIMKIVAKGDATKEQLEYFQGHINELTERLEAQKKAQQSHMAPAPSPFQPAAPPPAARPPATSPAPPVPRPPSSLSASLPTSGPPNALQHPQQPPISYYTPPLTPSPYTQHQPPPPPPPPQPSYRALCIDFNTNGDRLLFPRNTILEFLPGNAVLASFLIVQKVDHVTQNNLPKTTNYYKAMKEYYQPVTARFMADNPNLLLCLRRWVKPQDEVRKYMEEIMERCERAESVEIAARLPREGTKAAEVVDTHVDVVEKAQTPVGSTDKKRVKRAAK